MEITTGISKEPGTSIILVFAFPLSFSFAPNIKFLDKLLSRAEEIASGNFWRPTTEEIDRLRIALSLCGQRSVHWWSTHGGAQAARSAIQDWLKDPENQILERYHFDRFMKSVKNLLHKNDNPRFHSGEMAWIEMYTNGNHRPVRVLIVSDQYIKTPHGIFCNDILVDNSIISKPSERILKTKPRGY